MAGKQKKIVIAIVGPTAIGKTNISIRLQKELDACLISADSRQVYKEMEIGTAKPSLSEIASAQMKLVDHVSIHDNYNAGIYEKEALQEIENSFALGQIPILSGGTGLYLNAVTKGLNYFPDVSKAIQDQLKVDYHTKGMDWLRKQLELNDPTYYNAIETNNTHRVIRALGVIRASNQTFSHFLNQKLPERSFRTVFINLDIPRPQLGQRIDERVHKMIEMGLVQEVENLLIHKELKALQSVGYKELFLYLDNQISLDLAIKKIQTNTKRYAKRQMTWFKNQIVSTKFSPIDYAGILAFINAELNN